MKILIFGLFAFFSWSSFSTYIYVCRIKGLCDEPITMQVGKADHRNVMAADTIQRPLVKGKESIPKNLIIYFAFDKSEFNPDAGSDKYFDESNAYLNLYSQARINITGFTDAIGSNEYNQSLGYRRAQSLQHYFVRKGILVNKIIIESKGEKEPAGDNNTMAGRAINRRTAITIK